MPIEFAQPDPMGYSSSIGVGAGEAAATQKMAPTLAALYEHISEARQRSAMSGGGGGSSSTTPGGGGYGGGGSAGSGSDYDVQAQANREQSALNLGAQLSQPDYVGQHIQAEQQFKLKQQAAQQAADAAAQNGGQGGPPAASEPAPSWDPGFDQKNMDVAKQQIDTLQQKYENGLLSPDDPEAQQAYAEATAKIAALQDKKQKFDAYQQDQARQQVDAQDGHQHVRQLREQDTMAKYSPGQKLPSGDVVVSTYPDGQPAAIKTWNLEKHKWDIHNIPQARPDTTQDKAAEFKRKAESHEMDMEQKAVDHYLKIREHHVDRLNKEEDAFMKDTDGSRTRATPEGFDNTVAERMKAAGYAPTLGQFTEDWQKKRGTWKGPVGAPTAGAAQEDSSLMKQAKPEAIASLQSHVSDMPRLPTGQPNLAASTPDQLDKLKDYYTNHKDIGVSAENASKWVKAIDAAKTAQTAPAVPANGWQHEPVPTNRFGRGAARVADEVNKTIERNQGGTERVGRLTGLNSNNLEDFQRGAGIVGDTVGSAASQAKAAVGSVANRIDKGGENVYRTFKRWLGQ